MATAILHLAGQPGASHAPPKTLVIKMRSESQWQRGMKLAGQVQQALTQLGVPPKGAAMYIEMYKAINAGVLVPLEPRSPENTTPTSFEQFVQDVFAAAYHGKAPNA